MRPSMTSRAVRPASLMVPPEILRLITQGADVVLRTIRVQWDLRTLQHTEECGFASMEPREETVLLPFRRKAIYLSKLSAIRDAGSRAEDPATRKGMQPCVEPHLPRRCVVMLNQCPAVVE